MLNKSLLKPTPYKRFLFFLLSDILLIAISLYLSFLVRFDFNVPFKYFKNYFLYSLPFFIFVKIGFLYFFGLYRIVWRYVGLREFLNILKALFISQPLLFFLIKYLLSRISLFTGYPRSIFLIDFYISIVFISGLRIAKRIYLEFLCSSFKDSAKRTLIIGAGNLGEMIVRDLKRQNFKDYYPCVFLDDDPLKKNTLIHGVPVLGNIDELKNVVKQYGIESIIIAITNINYQKLRKIYQNAKDSGVSEIKIVPKIYTYTEPKVENIRLEDIKIEDLLKREEVTVEKEKIKRFLKDKRVLITGAGGSIGSELARQVASFEPKKLILFEIDETELHNLMLELKELYLEYFSRIEFIVGDITDEDKVDRSFKQYAPEIVFHAAAYKHVPMMEFNPEEAVRVNIFGTYIMAKTAVKYGTKKFIMISTDKAVRPTSIMGATKRIAEYICQALNNEKTEFVSVRFGNVLGSRGSVLPIFLEQIKKGGPVTVTHKDMQRYFMTVSEAVSLVLQASVMGRGGEVMVLDMGKPIKIVELAEELIRLHGLEPYKDIQIEFIGPRPGEKIFEELLTAEEGTVATYHDRVFIAKDNQKFSIEEVEKILDDFRELLKQSSVKNFNSEVRKRLKKYVKFFED